MKLRVVTGLLMGTMMSVIMSGFITLVNTGWDGDFMLRWLRSWAVAWVIAVPLAVMVGPIARKMAERLVKP